MQNYEVFIIVAVLAGIGYYFWKALQNNPPATPAKVKLSSGSNGSNLFPCNSFPCGMISRVVTCCGQVI